ncbi:hypothetical protein MCAG_03612 [Micromonospora sp. ATCC 39149]|nr:hypothetical protein MCAG_03612 [Micromonospora sp. ATCC 39149]
MHSAPRGGPPARDLPAAHGGPVVGYGGSDTRGRADYGTPAVGDPPTASTRTPRLPAPAGPRPAALPDRRVAGPTTRFVAGAGEVEPPSYSSSWSMSWRAASVIEPDRLG